MRGSLVAKINDFMTVGQASEYLGVSKDSLRRWDRAGKLKARRHPVSRYRLYLKSDLDTFLHEFAVGEVRMVRRNRTDGRARTQGAGPGADK